MKCNVLRDSKVIYNFGILTDDFLNFFFYYPEKANSSDKICICPESNHGVVWQYYIHVEHVRSGGKTNCSINWISYHCAINVYLVYLCIKVHIASFTDINMKGKFWRSAF